MRRYLPTIMVFAITCGIQANELDKLADEEQKCLVVMAATSAKLIRADKRLTKINRLIKKHQQFIYLKVRSTSEAKALAGLEKSNPGAYRLQLARIRLKVIADDPEVRDRINEIRRYHDSIERELGKNASIKAEHERLKKIRARLQALRQ